METNQHTMTVETATAELAAIGVTPEQMNVVTGFGLSRSRAELMGTILEKYRHRALAPCGVMAVLYGVDSPEHHAGKAK